MAGPAKPRIRGRMARGAGAVGIGLTTGLMKRDVVAGLPDNQKPHLLIDDYARLSDLLS